MLCLSASAQAETQEKPWPQDEFTGVEPSNVAPLIFL